MQITGAFPSLNSGMRRGRRANVPISKVASEDAGMPISGAPGMSAVAQAANKSAMLPPKRRRQITATAPVIGPSGPSGPPSLGGPGKMGMLSTLVKNALNPKKRGF